MTNKYDSPWTGSASDDGERISIISASKETVLGGCGCCGSPFTDLQNSQEVVDLMIAAPELLAHLEFAIKLLTPFGQSAQVKSMIAVVAKAKGETP